MAEPGCIFCRIVAGDEEAFVIGSSAGAVAFLDIAPLSRGHSLVVPTAHVPDLLAGGADVLHVVAPLVEETARLLVGRLGADGVNLFQSSGEAAGIGSRTRLRSTPSPFQRGTRCTWKCGTSWPAEELDALHAQLVG